MTNVEALYAAIHGRWARFLDNYSPLRAIDFSHASRPVIDLWTIQMGQWRLADRQGIEVIDITTRSKIKGFEPAMPYLMQYKRGEMSEEEYAERYLERMQHSLEMRPRTWGSLKTRSRMALACFCGAGEFCHRHLFADMASQYLERAGFRVHYHGEITE